MTNARRAVAGLILPLAIAAGMGSRAEVIEEIAAKVNDEIITRSDLQQAEEDLLAEMYKSHTGKDLDDRVRSAKAGLLLGLIDRKILVHRAGRLYDLEKMGDSLLGSFKESRKIKSDEELKRLLDEGGMTLDELKQKLIEMYAPEQVLGFEVTDRVSVGDKEVEAFYRDHPEASEIPAEATLREIVLLAEGDKKAERRAEAAAVRERAVAPGADFGVIASEVSESGTKAKGGLIENVKKGELADWIDAVAFSSPVGEVSQVLETPFGFQIVKVEARREASHRSLDEVREEFRKQIHEEKFEKAYGEFVQKARKEAEVCVSPKYLSRVPPDTFQTCR
jgi:peptidyl-prolyl cis-trans isomerase SurA